MTSKPPRRNPREVHAILAHLQLLADRPQLGQRFEGIQITTAAPYADSRRPTDPRQANRIDFRSSREDKERNYGLGLL